MYAIYAISRVKWCRHNLLDLEFQDIEMEVLFLHNKNHWKVIKKKQAYQIPLQVKHFGIFN